jgi:hypothetical protein
MKSGFIAGKAEVTKSNEKAPAWRAEAISHHAGNQTTYRQACSDNENQFHYAKRDRSSFEGKRRPATPRGDGHRCRG